MGHMQEAHPRVKLWIERRGLIVLSEYRVRLLEHIAETGSLAQAAERMGLSYRRAWGKIKEIEANLGTRLVQSQKGGAGGGRTRLTAEGARLVEAYRRLEKAVEAHVRREYGAVFGDVSL